MNTPDLIQTVGKYVIATVVLGASFVLIYTAQPGSDSTQAWTVIGLIVGWIVRDSAGQSATSNAVKTIQASTNGSSTGT